MIPISGSAYTYAYATLGEIFAWMIGWDLILEYAVGSMTVAVGWSGYFQRILAGLRHRTCRSGCRRRRAPASRARSSTCRRSSSCSSSWRCSSSACARARASTPSWSRSSSPPILFFIVVGVGYVKPENWSPFMPYGWPGVMAAAAVVFFAYIGFDAVSTTAEEAKNPSRDLPIGIIASLVICTVLYLAVAGILTGIIPVVRVQDRRAVPQRAGRLRAARHQPGLGRRPRVGRRRRRHHQRAARHAHEPAAHLLRDEPRRPAAAGRQQGASEVPARPTSRPSSPASSSPSSPGSRRSTSSAR